MFHRINSSPKVKAFLFSPLFHFFILGSLLYFSQNYWMGEWLRPEAEEVSYEIRLSHDRTQELTEEFLNQFGHPPNSKQINSILNREIEEQILFRQALRLNLEKGHPGIRHRLILLGQYLSDNPKATTKEFYQNALAMGLDKRDPVIRRQLVMAMKQVVSQVPLAGEQPIGEEDLKKYLSNHQEQFKQGSRFDFIHVFLRREDPGGRKSLNGLLEKIKKESIPPNEALDLGHPFLHGHEFSKVNEEGIKKFFGEQFSISLKDLAEGGWNSAIPSSYGWHLVFLKKTYPANLLEISQVKNQIFHKVVRKRQKVRLKFRLDQLKKKYSVVIEGGEEG